MRYFLAIVTIVSGWIHAAVPAHACSDEPGPDTSFRLHAAPVGGVWWVRNVDTRFTPDGLPLIDDAGGEVLAEIVTLGAQGTAAVRVPDVPVGTNFRAPGSVGDADLAFGEGRLVVVEGAAPAFDTPPPAPTITIEEREVRTGYTGVLTLPFPLCTSGGLVRPLELPVRRASVLGRRRPGR